MTMSASYFDLLKYAQTGIASPSMTYYDKMRASTLMGGAVQTLTGIPPLSFKSNGKPLISWSMKGNGSQQGTPTPDAPIMPTFCGVRTGNLFPLDATKLHVGRIDNDGTIGYEIGTITVGTNSVTYQANAAWRGFYTDYIRANENEKLTFSPNDSSSIALSCNCYDENDNFLGKAPAQSTDSIRTFTTLAGTKKVRISATSLFTEYTITNPMLNSGSNALPYEPYGWAEKITCAGQTVPVYLGQTQTVRRVKKLVLTGDENFNTDTYLRFSTFIGDIKTSTSRTGRSYCSHYECLYNAEPFDNDWNNVYYQSGATLYFHDKRFTTADDFKAYLAAQYAAGTPVCVWYVLATPKTGIVNEPICKIGDYADELNSADAGVTIPTINGSNTLTVETELQPSEMGITYRG
jgi:hypothetical protein